jgi:tetratricopeptide (TPR) repeat protein
MNDRTMPAGGTDQTQDLGPHDRDAFELVAEQFARECRAGTPRTISEYEALYPEHAEKIRRLLPTVALMEQLKHDTERDRSSETRRDVLPERLGEFRVIREIGRGGMGVVYEAVQESLGRHVALKVVQKVFLNAKRLQRFQREAQAVAQLHHTNIVPIFGIGEHDGVPFYAMQYIDGTGVDTLIANWRKSGAPAGADRWRFVAQIGKQVAEALEYAHGQGVLHRDVKPANLLIDAQHTVWITDFGLAKLAGREELTASGDVVGTLRYLAPEALNGQTDHQSDVYSLGLTLYELLTLSAPFGEVSPSELLRQVNESRPVRPRKLTPAIPRDLETIVLKAIAREPSDRYENAGALADDLNCFLQDWPIQARRATLPERFWRWQRRNRLIAAMLLVTLAVVVGAAVFGWVEWIRTKHALRRSNANVALSLEIFDNLFDQLAAQDHISSLPLGDAGGPLTRSRRIQRGAAPPPNLGPSPAFPPDHAPTLPTAKGELAPTLRDLPGGLMDDDGAIRKSGRPHGPPGPRSQQADSALLTTVLTFYERFAQENATNPRLEGEAAWAYRKVGALQERLGNPEQAEAAYARAISLLESLVARFPTEREYRWRLVQTFDMADPTVADDAASDRWAKRLERARLFIDHLVTEDPSNADYANFRPRIYVKLGATLQRLNRLGEAESALRGAIAMEDELYAKSPEHPPVLMDRATTKEFLAIIANDRGNRDEAIRLLNDAVADLETVKSSHKFRPPLFARLRSLALAFEKVGEPSRAQELRQWADEDESQPHPPPMKTERKRQSRGAP